MINLKSMFRAAAWLLFVAVVVVTLGSPRIRPTTDFSHDTEHAIAFVLLGIMYGIGYAERRVAMLLAAIPAIGVLEWLQLLAPGRHARLEDFVVNLVAFSVAYAATGLALHLMGAKWIGHDRT